MRRHTTIYVIACVVIAGVLIALFAASFIIHDVRQRQFKVAQQVVQDHGGSLRFDLVDGNYMVQLHGDAATDETIRKILPTLKRLPTGFTIIGPGEERLFWFTLDGPMITDSGISELCELRIAWLELNGGSITDAIAAKLATEHELYGVILNNVGLSESAIVDLRTAMPNATVMVDGASELPSNP